MIVLLYHSMALCRLSIGVMKRLVNINSRKTYHVSCFGSDNFAICNVEIDGSFLDVQLPL